MHKCFFYFDSQSITVKSVEDIVNNIIQYSPTKIEKYGTASGSMKTIKTGTNELLSKLAIGYPEYFFGSLFLSDKKNHTTFYLEHRPDHFFRLQIEFTNDVLEKDRLIFFEHFINNPDIFFGLMDKAEDYDQKHLLVTEHSGGGRTERYLGYDFYNGIPGIYNVTYFGDLLKDALNLENLSNIQKTNYGYRLYCNKDIEEEAVKNSLDKTCFFDIKNPDRKIKLLGIIQQLIDNLHSSDFSIKPHYNDPKFKINGESAKNAYQNELEPFIEGSSIENTDLNYIEDFITKKLIKLEQGEIYGVTILACGYLLGLYWSTKFSKQFNVDKGIEFIDDDLVYVLSPYNTVLLMKIDGLTIEEMEDCVEHLL
jgi:hypothetical protein